MDKRWRNLGIIVVLIVIILVVLNLGFLTSQIIPTKNVGAVFDESEILLSDFGESLSSFTVTLKEPKLDLLQSNFEKASFPHNQQEYADKIKSLIIEEKNQNLLIDELVFAVDNLTFSEYCPKMENWENNADLAMDSVDKVLTLGHEIDEIVLDSGFERTIVIDYNNLADEMANYFTNIDSTNDMCIAAVYSDEIDYSELDLNQDSFVYVGDAN